MAIKKWAIAICSGTLLLTAIANHALAASAEWPKELRDKFSSECNATLFGDGELSEARRKILPLTCECLVEGYSKTIPKDVAAVLIELTGEELEKLPEYGPAKDVAPTCFQKHGLQALLDAEKLKPLPQEWREDLLMGCVFENIEDAKDLENGSEKLAKACRCIADRFLPKVRSYASEKELTEAAEATSDECKKIHLTDK